MNTLLAVLTPLVTVGSSSILNWLITMVIIAATVWFVVFLVTKFAGPPSLPDPVKWVIWIVVAIGLLIFLFSALGIALP